MASPTMVTPLQLQRLVGLPDAPTILDVRTDEDRDVDPRFLPASVRCDLRTVDAWAGDHAGAAVVVICHKGGKLSTGVAAWLRHVGADAETLEGGFEAWRDAGGLLVRPSTSHRATPWGGCAG